MKETFILLYQSNTSINLYSKYAIGMTRAVFGSEGKTSYKKYIHRNIITVINKIKAYYIAVKSIV